MFVSTPIVRDSHTPPRLAGEMVYSRIRSQRVSTCGDRQRRRMCSREEERGEIVSERRRERGEAWWNHARDDEQQRWFFL